MLIYLIVLAAPSIESNLEELGGSVFGEDETYSPITLIVLSIDEVTFFVVLGNVIFLAFAHRYINYQRITIPN